MLMTWLFCEAIDQASMRLESPSTGFPRTFPLRNSRSEHLHLLVPAKNREGGHVDYGSGAWFAPSSHSPGKVFVSPPGVPVFGEWEGAAGLVVNFSFSPTFFSRRWPKRSNFSR